jgi:hypothetical protein
MGSTLVRVLAAEEIPKITDWMEAWIGIAA